MVADIESSLPVPSGQNGAEILLWNALRIVGSKCFGPANLVQLRQACAHFQSTENLARVSAEFRRRLKPVLELFSDVSDVGEEGPNLSRELLAILRSSL